MPETLGFFLLLVCSGMIATGPAGGVIPPRPADASGGAAFMERIADLPPSDREEAMLKEILRGNIPPFLRHFKTIPVTATDSQGKMHTASYEVMPDYLAVGSDTDFVRVPMTPMTARQIAEAFNCSLPSSKMVSDIYAHADLKLEPRPLTQEREAVRTFVWHNTIIEDQRSGQPLGQLVAGIKKDVVLTNRLQYPPGKVAIFGWHHLDGTPIQPLTTVHRETYVDYSHGIRLIRQKLLVDGKETRVSTVLGDPLLSVLLSDEGPIK